MLGTPDFMAPEQIIDSQKSDIRADIYSLGCTLYYLVCGEPPFHASNFQDVLLAHLSIDARPLNHLRPEVPVGLASLVATMMAKEPSRRLQTPAETARVLAPFYKKQTQVFMSDNFSVAEATTRAAEPAPVEVAQTSMAPASAAHPNPAPVTQATRETSLPETRPASIVEEVRGGIQAAFPISAQLPKQRQHRFRRALATIERVAGVGTEWRPIHALLILMGVIAVVVLAGLVWSPASVMSGFLFSFLFGTFMFGALVLSWIADKKD
jgi:hypothetical protein